MPSKVYYQEEITRELRAALEARNSGNEGRARVCARRACGQAISWYLSVYPQSNWGSDALKQLTVLSADPVFPTEVRDAAQRLITRITDMFAYAFPTDPIDDAKLIIRYFQQLIDPTHVE